MRVLVVDEDRSVLDGAVGLLNTLDGDCVIETVTSGVLAVPAADPFKPDIILIQYNMDEMSGTETARHLSKLKTPAAVIFLLEPDTDVPPIASYIGIPYIHKPLQIDSLRVAIQSASQTHLASISEAEEFKSGLWNTSDSPRMYLEIGEKGNTERIPVGDVQLFRANAKNVEIHTFGRIVLTEEPLELLEKEFSDTFLRVDTNCLVSTIYLKGLTETPEGIFQVSIADTDEVVEVGGRYVAEARRFLKSGVRERNRLH